MGLRLPATAPFTVKGGSGWLRRGVLGGAGYPHARDEGSFLRALVGQCRAALLAMRAIRARIPAGRFVHTEDVGRIFSTPPLAAQARYENDRRWLSLDLLCGRVGRDHPWRGALEAHGVSNGHLDALATGEAAPDLIGVNHYVTSDRFLDHRIDLYPPHLCGGNGRQLYADTEAVRARLGCNATGWEPRLREVWTRYERPMAVTEAHLGCEDPEEALRWLMEAWRAARNLRMEGANIRAVTAWALLGSVDWDTLLCEIRGRRQQGALDPARDPPCDTLLAAAINALARDGAFTHAALNVPGWWRREDRFLPGLRQQQLGGIAMDRSVPLGTR